MVDVFISYARANQEMVRQLAEAVKREGYDVWWDDELPPHLAYGDVITEKIGAAKAAIVVWSHDAAASEWVRAEADVARNQKKLIQVSLDGHMPPLPFNQLHFVSIGDWRGEADHIGWRKVKESLAALCGAGSTERSAYPMPTMPPPRASPPPAAPHKWHKLLIAVIAVSFLAIAAVGLFAWLRSAPPPPVAAPSADPARADPPMRLSEPGPVTPDKAEAPPPRTAATPPPRPAIERPQPRPSLNMRDARRYCIGPGRGTPRCRRFREMVERR